MIILLLLACLTLANGAPTTATPPKQLHHLTSNEGIHGIFDLLPKVCKKNGKTYQIGDDIIVGNLLYKCQEFGVYTIHGCQTHNGKNLNLGDIKVIDHVKFHCLAHGTSVFYRETACGQKGEVDCDKVPLPRGYEAAIKEDKHPENPKLPEHSTHIDGKPLPKGWILIHGNSTSSSSTDTDNDKKFSTHVLMYHPQQHHHQ